MPRRSDWRLCAGCACGLKPRAADVRPEGRARCVSSARRDLCGGRGVILVPTATMGQLTLSLDLILPRASNREAWLVGENLREKIDEDPELGGQPSATGTDRADRKRRRFIITEHETHGAEAISRANSQPGACARPRSDSTASRI